VGLGQGALRAGSRARRVNNRTAQQRHAAALLLEGWRSRLTPLPLPPHARQGDPTFLYGGFGYRPPNFGYAWLGTGGATSFSQLPVQQNASSGSVTPSPPVTSPKSLAK
jgi:hypothetical protein